MEEPARLRRSTRCVLLAERPIIQDGYIKVPETPGIGGELNEEAAREFARPETGCFE